MISLRPLALLATLSLATLSLVSPALAGLPSEPTAWGISQAFTSALTISYTAPGTVAKDDRGKPLTAANGGGPAFGNTYTVDTFDRDGNSLKSILTDERGSKPYTFKYGNVEILKALVANGDLPAIGNQATATHAGWALVLIRDETSHSTLYARHTASKTLIPVTGFSFAELAGGNVQTDNQKTITTTVNNPATSVSSESLACTGTFSYRSPGAGSAVYNGTEIPLTGLYTETGAKSIVKVEKLSYGTLYNQIGVPGARKLDHLTGTLPLEVATGSTAALVEGSLSLAAGVIIDIYAYYQAKP